MIKVKVSALSGPALDWAVAKAAGIEVWLADKWLVNDVQVQKLKVCDFEYWSPSTNWSQGGPLIDSHKVVVVYHNGPDGTPMATTRERSPAFESGDTILIAAMRAIVAANFGDELGVPEEMVT